MALPYFYHWVGGGYYESSPPFFRLFYRERKRTLRSTVYSLFVFFFSVKACVIFYSYSVVKLRGLRLSSNTALYDGARPGACSHPSLPRRVQHDGGRRPAPQPRQRTDLAVMRVELLIWNGPPQVQDSWGWARTGEQASARNRGPLCARQRQGWIWLSHTAACLVGNLLAQLWLAKILSSLAQIKSARMHFYCVGN